MSDRLISIIRTVVPALWSAQLAWLASLGLPAQFADALLGVGEQLLVPLVLAVVYSGLRWIEPHLPPWLARILLGWPTPPTYPSPAPSLVGDSAPVADGAQDDDAR